MRARALPLLLFVLSCSSEQHTHPIPRVSAQKGPVLTAQVRDFLERAAEGNNAEVSIGTLVHGRALRTEVVQLGVMVASDHKAAKAQLAAEFVKVMIDDHHEAVRLYRGALASVVDRDLRAYAAATLPKIDAHLAHAKSLWSAAAQPPL